MVRSGGSIGRVLRLMCYEVVKFDRSLYEAAVLVFQHTLDLNLKYSVFTNKDLVPQRILELSDRRFDACKYAGPAPSAVLYAECIFVFPIQMISRYLKQQG